MKQIMRGKIFKNITLFLLMFLITTVVVAIELGSIHAALKVAGIVAPVKTGGVFLHSWIFSKLV